jgi:hypothetical protein
MPSVHHLRAPSGDFPWVPSERQFDIMGVLELDEDHLLKSVAKEIRFSIFQRVEGKLEDVLHFQFQKQKVMLLVDHANHTSKIERLKHLI